MDRAELIASVRSELKRLRDENKIPTEVRLTQTTWNTIRSELAYGPYGPRQSVLFDGLPCVLAFGTAVLLVVAVSFAKVGEFRNHVHCDAKGTHLVGHRKGETRALQQRPRIA